MENDATHGADPNVHDLEQIKGIGPTFARALHRLGITRFADLAACTPDELSHALRERAGVSVAADRILSADWIGQARQLAGQGGGNREAAAAPEQGEGDRLHWRQQAGFSLFFDFVPGDRGAGHWQTRVYHDETGEEAQFAGVDTGRWVAWVLDRAGLPDAQTESAPSEHPQAPLPAPAPGERPSGPSRPLSGYDVWLDIVDMTVGAATEAGDSRLVTQIDFRLAGEDAETLADRRASYQVEVQAVGAGANANHFAESGQSRLEPGKAQYSVWLDLPLPGLGRYELLGTVHLLPPVDLLASYNGPLVRVVP